MFPSTKAPAILATTALMILRNQLSQRVWGTYGVNTLAIDDPRPLHAGTGGVAAHNLLLPEQLETMLPREHGPGRQNSDTRPKGLSGISIIGDSISDEDRFYAPDRVTARNWVEILATTRGLPFGDPVITTRGAAQDRRFAHNWSHSGATTT